MKALAIATIVASTTAAAMAQDMIAGGGGVLVDPDFGLTLQTPSGFEAEMVGQTPDGVVLITVSTPDPGLPAEDPSGKICDITFQYQPAYGQGDQAWVNSLVDGTGFYEQMARDVVIPGTVESTMGFTHHGASAHLFRGQGDAGASFQVAAIPSPEGFALLVCTSSNADADWDKVSPLIDALTIPGQPRDHLVAGGACTAEVAATGEQLADIGQDRPAAGTIAALDGERERIAALCGGIDADALMDEAVAQAGAQAGYRELRYAALARIGSDLLSAEQHEALEGGRAEVVATSDAATGERYVRYMHFIVGLRSLE